MQYILIFTIYLSPSILPNIFSTCTERGGGETVSLENYEKEI